MVDRLFQLKYLDSPFGPIFQTSFQGETGENDNRGPNFFSNKLKDNIDGGSIISAEIFGTPLAKCMQMDVNNNFC